MPILLLHFILCPLAFLVLPTQCPSLPLLIMPGTVQSDCFGSLRVPLQDLLFVLTLDVNVTVCFGCFLLVVGLVSLLLMRVSVDSALL